MNTRRNFLSKAGMATTAFLAAKPFESVANNFPSITGFSVNENKIVLVHTADNIHKFQSLALQQIGDLKNSTGNVLLLHAGQQNKQPVSNLNYDCVCKTEDCVSADGNYKIIHKGNLKIGVITAIASQKNTIENINTFASFLKKEKNCEVVICLSQLGYKNKTAVDDLKLAEASDNIDVIIGGRADNFTAHPVVAQNSKRAEVIIHADAGNGFAFGNIEITFDKKRNKKSIAINDLTKRSAITA